MTKFTVFYNFNNSERKQVIMARDAAEAEKKFKERYKYYEFLRAEAPAVKEAA